MKKFLLTGVIFIVLVLNCNANIVIRYKGLDNAHLEFSNWENFPAKIQIKVVETEEVLFEQTLPEGGGNISGKIHHTGLTQGTYTYQLWADSNLRYSEVVQINGKISGELLYDETINDTAFLEGNVVVPAGKTFNVNGNLVKDNSINNNVYINGTISFQTRIALKEVNIHFKGESVEVSGIEGNGSLIFYSQASGSKIKDCKGQLGITVKENTSVSIEISEIYGFGMEETGTSLNIKDSIISGYIYLTKIQNLQQKVQPFLN